MDLFQTSISLKSIAMTNKEILGADLLDILFENRNKAYGAYALRKNYNHRLQWALGIWLMLVLCLSLLNFSAENLDNRAYSRPDVVLQTVDLSNDRPKIPQTRQQKKLPAVARVRNTQIQIVVDNEVKRTEVPAITDLQHALTSTINQDGISPDSRTDDGNGTNVNANNGDKKNEGEPGLLSRSSEAQFPGGKEAFVKFLTRNLVTPAELEVGEKKTVLVRFMVDTDGSISKIEILQSDGENYTKEVIRVLNKMPKWIPATQNGLKCATWFSQPVTFIGVE